MATTEVADQADGAFLFARQVMLLVELASTIAGQHPATLRLFAEELQKREPLLFKPIPYRPARGTRSCVPRVAPIGDPTSELIALLFDLIRNGQAHFGHQLYAPLKDGAVGVIVYGVTKNRTIDKIVHARARTIDHLCCRKQPDGNLVILPRAADKPWSGMIITACG